MSKVHNPVADRIRSHWKLLSIIIAFIIPVIIRAIPEILMGQFLAGFDTMAYYVPYTVIWLKNGVGFWTLLGIAPLFYLLLMGATSIANSAIIPLKIISPLLLGFLGVAIYSYANKTLSWSSKKSLFVALLATSYFVSLRISWDMLRSEIGLIFLFVSLIFLSKGKLSLKTGVPLSLLMLLVVFSDQLVALVMFSIAIATILASYFNKQLKQARQLVFCSIPAMFMFFVILFAAFMSSQISFSHGILSQGTQGLSTIFGFSSSVNMLINTGGFFLFCYLPFLPLLILKGNQSHLSLQLKAWIFLIVLAIILSFVVPNAIIGASSYRWILLLTYPMAFIVVEIVSTLRSRMLKFCTAILLITIVVTLSTAFVVLPSQEPFQYFSLYPLYIPTSMLQNTVPLYSCQDTVNALQWAKSNMGNNSLLLVHEAFYGWAALTFNNSTLFLYGYDNPLSQAGKLFSSNSSHNLYLIWWTNGTGWYGQSTVSSPFIERYRSGEIAVYSYNPP